MNPGQWAHPQSLRVGRDIPELLADLRSIPYRDAQAILADQFDRLDLEQLDRQSDHLPRMEQERRPLFVPLPFPSNGLLGTQRAIYHNSVGVPIGVVDRWPLKDGTFARQYATIWKKKSGKVGYWVETFPSRPLMLFNADQIAERHDTKVVFVGDEFLAQNLGLRHPNVVFSAVPGGSDHLLDADFSALVGRHVHLQLLPQDVRHCRIAYQRLDSAGASEVTFALGARPLSIGEIEAYAEDRGILMVEPAANLLESLTTVPSLVAVNLDTFLDTPLPPREYVLAPIIPEQGLVMLYAPRGIGKTHVALGCAHAVATGGNFLRWTAQTAKRVLYLDGEMPAGTMQDRLASLCKANRAMPADGFLRVITPDLQRGCMPDISSPEGQAVVNEHLDGISLLVLDNLSTLCRDARENGADGWGPVQAWLLDLRRRGISVLVVHHAGKNGGQRGTSRREDVLDTVIGLRRPNDYIPSQGARFEVHVEKGRGLFGEDAAPFEAKLEAVDGVAEWVTQDLMVPLVERAFELFSAGLSVREVAGNLSISKSAAGRIRERLVEEDRLD